jgi:aldehyde dehydrogenase (NAD+)
MSSAILTRHTEAASQFLPTPALFIGADRVTETSSGTLDRIDPTTGAVLASFPVAGPEELDRAVAAAWSAFPAWKAFPADERRRLLHRLAATIREHHDELKQIVALETGTPVSVGGFEGAADHLEYYAGWADKFEGELITSYPARAFDYVKYEPYGVIGAIATWNGPITNACMKLAPALAAGNCVVLKSPEQGPFALMRMIELFLEVGLPAGVVNLISGGPDTVQGLIRHSGIRKVSFTGGPQIARKIMATAAESLTPVTLELGGKSANLIFADADLDRATTMAALMSTIASSGQGCLFPTRLLVESSVYDEVVDRVSAISRSVAPGDPLDTASRMGPVIGETAVDRILGFVEEAKGYARLVAGGERFESEWGGGSFIPPTVFADVAADSRLALEEVFGPVLAITPFDTELDALRIANSTEYGLAAYVHTNDLRRALRVADELDAGYIGVNGFPIMTASAPFGGIKSSGFGREGGRAGIEEFVHHKNVYIPLD